MKKYLYLATIIVLTRAAVAQSGPVGQEVSIPVIESTSRLVIVPTLVRSASGDLVTNLNAADFRLTDNGVEKKVIAVKENGQPIAKAVLMQTGGAIPAQFQKYRSLSQIIKRMMDNPDEKVALVTFDSRVEEIWNFSPRVDVEKLVFDHLGGGDHGASIIDAVECGIDLLKPQPLSFCRIVLLLSQPQDQGSKARVEEVLRRLGESNIAVYSVTLSQEKPLPRNRDSKAPQGDQTSRMHAGQGSTARTTSSSELLEVASMEVRRQAAPGFASFSGGAQIALKGDQDLERTKAILAKDISTGYTLTFQPASTSRGFTSSRLKSRRSCLTFQWWRA